jgi:hypothetical protein
VTDIDGVYIKLVNTGKSEVEGFSLAVDTVQHTITRNPIVFPIPGVNFGTTGQPMIFGLDFGMMSETITFSGVLKDNDDAPDRPNHQELAAAARTWWRYLNVTCGDAQSTNVNKILVKEGPGHGTWIYGGIIQSATFTREGGKTYWTYRLTFQIVQPPSVDPAWEGPSW